MFLGAGKSQQGATRSTEFWPGCLEGLVFDTSKDTTSEEPAQIIPHPGPHHSFNMGTTPAVLNLLGACGLVMTLPVPQSLHLYHVGVDSILMSWTAFSSITRFPLLSLNCPGLAQSPGGWL